jgi:antiviral helicase SKI2
MILGEPTKLRSQFRLTYNMILNLLRVEALKIEEMIKRSFSENATQALLPEHEKQVKVSEADLAKIKRAPCDICDVDLEECHEGAMTFTRLTGDLHLGLMASPAGRRLFASKRIVVFQRKNRRMVGVLLKEGMSRGVQPLVQVLQVGPVPAVPAQQTTLLPYLPKFRQFFEPLPKPRPKELFQTTIPLGDVECVTKTMIKIDINGVLKHEDDALQAAADELARVCTSWTGEEWDELDWTKVKDLQLRDVLEKRKRAAEMAEVRRCLTCPDFITHFSMIHDEYLIKENISQLRQLMSDQNLQLLPDYEQRIAVLKDLSFIDDRSRVQLKGKVACEIHSADELVLTELVLENVLADFEPEEIVALLSAFVFQEKTDHVPTLTPRLEQGRETIITISEKVNAFQTQHQVILSSDDSNDFLSRPRFGLMEVVYEWARGMSFLRITELTDVLEGTIVRVITRLDETCREVKNAARIIGDPELFQKMQACQEMIKRDVTAVASL